MHMGRSSALESYAEYARQRHDARATIVRHFAICDVGGWIARLSYTICKAERQEDTPVLCEVRPGLAVDLASYHISYLGQLLNTPPACGHLLVYLSSKSAARTGEIAQALHLSEHTIHNAVRALRGAGIHIRTVQSRYCL